MPPNDPGPTPAQGTPPSADLEPRLARMEALLAGLEARLAALEVRPAPPALRAAPKALAAPPPPESSASGPSAAPGFLGLAGLAFLAFGGAFFLRAMTEAGRLPRGAGVGVGMAYACLWLIAADRAKRAPTSTVLAFAAGGIFFPLLWEATLKLKALSAGAAAVALLVAGPALVAVAWRRSLQAAAWGATMLSLLMGAALMLAAGAFEAFSPVFIAFGAGTLWLTEGRQWPALRWPAALAADWSALVTTVLIAWPGDAPKDAAPLSTARVLGLDMVLVLVYLGSFSVTMLRRRRPVDLFVFLQTGAVLFAGFGGAALVAQRAGSGAGFLGGVALAAGAAAYACAMAFPERAAELKSSLYFSSLGLVCFLAGAPMLLSWTGLAALYIGLGALIAVLGLRLGRGIWVAHAAIFLSLGAFLSGGLDGLFHPSSGIHAPGLRSALVLVSLVGVFAMMRLHEDPSGLPWYARIPSTVLGTLAALALGELILAGLGPLFPALQDPGTGSALRTVLLASLALGLAAAARLPGLGFRWLVHPLLAATGLQLLTQALPEGRPSTLFIAFVCFGAALALSPKMLKKQAA